MILTIIIIILLFDYFLERYLDYLNGKNRNTELPPALKGIYDEENISETIKIIDFEEPIQNLDDDFIGKKVSLFI